MTESDKDFVGSIPEFYDTYLVPLIFDSYAEDIAERVAQLAPTSILETAAGSGIVPRLLAPRLNSDARYVVTDLNQPMLDHAASKQGPDERIEWRQADALDLPFDDNSFDVVICQFGVMFYPDRGKGYREARRVLKPGGSFIFSVWDHIGENEFAGMITDTAAAMFPANPPEFLARTPYGYHDKSQIWRDLNEAGFRDAEIETLAAVSTAGSARHPAIAYCHGTPLRNEIEACGPGKLEVVTNAAAAAIAERFGSEGVSAKMQAHVISATIDA